MGILYTVVPLDSEARSWLRSQEIAYPATPSRWPTRGEVRAVLEDLKGFKVKYTENGPGRRWDAFLSDGEEDGNRTLLHAEPQNNNDDVTRVHFEKGEPTLIVAVLRALAAVTGPFMLVPDIAPDPLSFHRATRKPIICMSVANLGSTKIQAFHNAIIALGLNRSHSVGKIQYRNALARPPVLFRAPASNRPWHPTISRRAPVRVRPAVERPSVNCGSRRRSFRSTQA
jgi:hypothetical protein